MQPYTQGQLSRDLARARAGNAAALDDLLCRLHPALVRYARARLSAEPDADELAQDLAQDALIRVLQKVEQCHGQDDKQILAWALAIARNICLDHFRAVRRRPSSVRLSWELGELLHPCSAADPRTDGTGLPRPAPGRRLLRALLRDAVRSLSPTARRLLRLRIEQDETWGAVAEDLGLTQSAAKRRFQRLQVSLRKDVLRRVGQLGSKEHDSVLRYLDRQYR
ncbi:MAG: sigma-70 family RNA polymerase sigma factor [Gemmatimonadota bacterium]|nr:sigma-70 family RNA polymerase sigma factor [Gemmatimonadota bacterium]